MHTARLPLLLTGYGVPYSMGYIPLKDGSPNPQPLDAVALADRAARMGLAGIEVPLTSRVPSFEGRVVELAAPHYDLGKELRKRDMSLVADYGVIVDSDADHFRSFLKTAQQMGATVVRATLSNVLCGDRRTCAGGWDERLQAGAKRLREVLPLAEQLGLVIAIENHQDATTDDLLQLGDMAGGSASYGVTFDTGNPLAVAEDPVKAARRLAHVIRHVHLKDYTMHFAPDGYRLVRCAAGDGVVDFPAILAIVAATGVPITPGVEIAAQATRTIPLLDPGWWSTYDPRPATDLIAPLKMLFSRGRPADEPYSSAWERGAPGDEIISQEWDVLTRSVNYFARLQRQ